MKNKLLFLFVLIPAIASSQKMMDLRECLRTGLENNYDLRITRNEEQISDNNVTLGNAGFLPDISLNSGITLRNSNSDQFPAEGGDVVQTRHANTGTMDAGINLNWTLFEGNEYATEIFGEPKLTKIAGILAGALLLALVGGALI